MELSALNKVFDKTGEDLLKALSRALIDQGHRGSGKLLDSLSFDVVQTGDSIELQIKGNDYGIILDTGVKWQNIPFGRGGGSSSLYIEGLMKWIRSKGMASSNKNVRSIAFAIANTQIKNTNNGFGMPTKGSLKYSKTGKRTGWLTDTINDKENTILEQVQRDIGIEISLNMERIINKAQTSANKA